MLMWDLRCRSKSKFTHKRHPNELQMCMPQLYMCNTEQLACYRVGEDTATRD